MAPVTTQRHTGICCHQVDREAGLVCLAETGESPLESKLDTLCINAVAISCALWKRRSG